MSTKAGAHSHQQHHQNHQQHHHQQQQQPNHPPHPHDDTKKNTEKNRRISQFSRDIHNMGHSHFSHSHSDRDSKRSRHDGSESTDKPERHRRISHHSRDHHGGRPRAGSRKEHDRHSVATSGDIHPPIEYENTYKLEPDSVFKPGQVQEVIKQVLHENLHGRKYINGMMGEQCATLSDKIKERVRQLNMHRFKIVCTVLIGERRNQSMLVSSRCLWNQAYDNFASSVYNKDNLCAVGMVFAVYQE